MVAVEGIQTGILQWKSASHNVEVSSVFYSFDKFYYSLK